MELKTLSTQSTKSQELTQLTDYQTLAGTGSYLAMLFSNDFMVWAENQIKDDFSLDLMAEYKAVCNELSELASDKLKSDSKIKMLESQLENQSKIIREQADKITNLNQWNRENSDKVLEYYHAMDEHKEIILEQENEIIRLKARLFDLLNA